MIGLLICVLGYILVAGLFHWLILATNEHWSNDSSIINTWTALAWVFPLGIVIYVLRLIVMLPRAIYESHYFGWHIWKDYFLPWYAVVW